MNSLAHTALPYILNAIMLLICYDAMSWACTLIRHSFWLGRHPERIDADCDRLTHRMLLAASTLSGLHLLAINLTWIYVNVFYGYHIESFILVAGVNVMVIHLYALLARCTQLGKTYWPYFSIIIAESVMSPCRAFIVKQNKCKHMSTE